MSRGILYITWGKVVKDAAKSCRSAKKLKLPTCLITDNSTIVPNNVFTKVIRIKWNPNWIGKKCFIRKTVMYNHSPFDTTLFLDADTFVLADDLRYIFEMAELHGICLTIAGRSSLGEIFRHNQTLSGLIKHKDAVSYSTGSICFKKSDKIKAVFTEYRKLMEAYHRIFSGDQEFLSVAIHKHNISPFVIPNVWNLGFVNRKNLVYNAVKVWHSRAPIPPGILNFNSNHRPFLAINGMLKRFEDIENSKQIDKSQTGENDEI